MSLSSHPTHFLDSLSFLTRLVPARDADEERIAKSMGWLPLTGLVLGAVIALPFHFGLLADKPWISAWLVVVLSAWLTRGLHLDGIADVMDGVTTHTTPYRFWEVVKDSRCGAFGVLALVMAGLGMAVLLQNMFAAKALGAVVWIFMFGRFGGVALGYMAKDFSRPGMGEIFMRGATLNAVGVNFILTAGVGIWLVGFWAMLMSMVLLALTNWSLYRLVTKVQGVNGDFLGASIVLGELCAGLGFALVM